MKRILRLGAALLALGSCQSESVPTQPEAAADQVSVSARLHASAPLPGAQRFRARLIVGDVVGPWRDTSYATDAVLNLGKVKRGTLVVLDVRGYSFSGTDTVWKWFAHKSDSAKGTILAIEGEVEPVAPPVVQKEQVLRLPAGSWYTTNATSWSDLSRVDSMGTIPPLSGGIVRVRLRVAVPGTRDTLLGDTLRLTVPRKPTFQPSSRSLGKTDSVRISGASGDSLVYCEGTNCSDWKPYRNALAPKTSVLRSRAWRDGLLSAIETASFTLADGPDTPPDTVVGKPTFSPYAGSIASTDKISIAPAKQGDSIRYTTDGEDWNVYSGSFAAGDFTVRAVGFRGKYVSDTAEARYVVRSTKPSSPSIVSICQGFRDCDPGTTFELKTMDTGVTLEYALSPDSSNWMKYDSKVPLSRSATVLARAVGKTDTSAVQRQSIVIAQPDTVGFDPARQTPDTVWVKLSTTSGAIWYAHGASTAAQYTDSIPVRVGDSLLAWTSLGTKRSDTTVFHAKAVKPAPPKIASPTDSVIALKDSIVLEVAAAGDTLEYKAGADWAKYAGKVAPGKGGAFTIFARSRRNGLVSDSVSKDYFVDTAKLASPSISPGIAGVSNPGTRFTISVGVGSTLEVSSDSSSWEAAKTPLEFTADRDTAIYARAKTDRKISSARKFDIRIRQPGTVEFKETTRFPDSVKLAITPSDGDTILYSRNSEPTSTKASISGTVAITVLANDSITAWTERGTAEGAKRGYRMVPAAPKAPTVSPNGGDVRDTTRIELSPAMAGDSVYYRIGSGGDWIAYERVFKLPQGDIDLHVRSTRNRVAKDTSIVFAVHALPKLPGIVGCVSDCDPGSSLTFTATGGTDVYVKIDGGAPVKRYDLYKEPITATSTKVCAYSDSAGYRSADSCVTVTIKLPVAPTIASARVVHGDGYDSAYVAVKATQGGDRLAARFGATDLDPVPVSSTPLTHVYGIRWTDSDSILTVSSKRGTANSSSVEYTLSRLPVPKADFAAGDYMAGKTFTFARDLAAGGLGTDTIYLSADQGDSWIKSTSLKLAKTAEIWAKAKRKGYGDAVDSSNVLKVAYVLDSEFVSSIKLVLGSGTAEERKSEFDMTRLGADHKMMVPDHIASLGVEFVVKGDANDISKYEVRCVNCSNSDYVALTGAVPTIALGPIGMNYLTFRVTTAWNLVRTYRIAVQRTAPWNGDVAYGESIQDGRGDGEEYKTVTIGGMTWMAENLRYVNKSNGTGETCYGDDTANCREYGRLYTWAEAMGANRDCDTTDCSVITPSGNPAIDVVDGICPYGFRLPEFKDWQSLAEAAGTTNLETLASQQAPSVLRADSKEWSAASWFSGNDALGFRALPAGYQDASGTSKRLGEETMWWMANQGEVSPETGAFVYQLYGETQPNGSFAAKAGQLKTTKLSVRCVKK